MKKIMFLLVSLLFIGLQAFAQTTITGVVTDDSGDPIPGANVRAKGISTSGTITNLDGKYSLKVPTEVTTLIFSSVGMGSIEIEIGGRAVIDAQLKTQDESIGEVVVTALGISREKKSIGYAVQEVGGEELNKATQNDALSALSGKVAGVEIRSSSNLGGSSRVLIRGANSITGENQPLIVIDGVPIDNSNYNSLDAQAGYGGVDYGNMLNDIDPSEIKSVSVLKGPAAALYGSRASNGVIVITTKQGAKGRDVFSIDVGSSMTFERVYMIPELQRKYGGGGIISDSRGGVNGFLPVTINGKQYLTPLYMVDESWGPRYNPNIKVLHWDAFDKEFPEDYLKERPWVAPENDVLSFWEYGLSYQNSIGISKSGKEYAVRFAYTNVSTDGTLPGSEMSKNNFKLSGTSNIGKHIVVGANLNFSLGKTKGRPTVGYDDNSVGQKFFQWGERQLDFERLKKYKKPSGVQRPWNRSRWNNATPKYADNPYWTVYENYPEDERTRFFGNVSLEYKIMKGLSVKGSIYGDSYTFYVRERAAVGSQATPFYYEAVRSNSEFNYEAILNYSTRFADIGVNAFAGLNRRNTRYDFNSGKTAGGLVVPKVYTLLNSVDNASTEDYTSEKRVNSVFASLSLDYKSLIYFEGSVRNDWSSTLPEDNNSYFYPAASLSFVFSELFDYDWFNLGKIRFGWSKVGSDTKPYRVKSIYKYNTNSAFNSTPRLYVDTYMANKDLKPEMTQSLEVGLELEMFVSRLSINATYFDNTTTDQILPLELSKATGYSSKYVNSGEMKNSGFEISVGGTPVKLAGFQWNINVNFTKVKNEVVSLYQGLDAMNITKVPFGGVTLRASVGDTYGQLWGYDYVRDDAGNKVVTEDGMWMRTKNLVPLGSVLPDYNMGIRNTFSYKGVELGFLFDIQRGGKFYSLTHMWGMYSGMLKETAGINDKGYEIRDKVSDGGGIRLDGVTADVTFDEKGNVKSVTNSKPNTKYVEGSSYAHGVYHGNGTPSAQSVFNADYIKLREITLGYTLPKLDAFNGAIKNIYVSVYGRNLFTFGLDKEGFDPEMTVTGSGNIQGVEGGLQPMSRTFGFSVKLNF